MIYVLSRFIVAFLLIQFLPVLGYSGPFKSEKFSVDNLVISLEKVQDLVESQIAYLEDEVIFFKVSKEKQLIMGHEYGVTIKASDGTDKEKALENMAICRRMVKNLSGCAESVSAGIKFRKLLLGKVGVHLASAKILKERGASGILDESEFEIPRHELSQIFSDIFYTRIAGLEAVIFVALGRVLDPLDPRSLRGDVPMTSSDRSHLAEMMSPIVGNFSIEDIDFITTELVLKELFPYISSAYLDPMVRTLLFRGEYPVSFFQGREEVANLNSILGRTHFLVDSRISKENWIGEPNFKLRKQAEKNLLSGAKGKILPPDPRAAERVVLRVWENGYSGIPYSAFEKVRKSKIYLQSVHSQWLPDPILKTPSFVLEALGAQLNVLNESKSKISKRVKLSNPAVAKHLEKAEKVDSDVTSLSLLVESDELNAVELPSECNAGAGAEPEIQAGAFSIAGDGERESSTLSPFLRGPSPEEKAAEDRERQAKYQAKCQAKLAQNELDLAKALRSRADTASLSVTGLSEGEPARISKKAAQFIRKLFNLEDVRESRLANSITWRELEIAISQLGLTMDGSAGNGSIRTLYAPHPEPVYRGRTISKVFHQPHDGREIGGHMKNRLLKFFIKAHLTPGELEIIE